MRFDQNWPYDQPDPHDARKSKTFINAHGVEQGTCVHLGNCDIGCDVNARNTLDLNYLAVAEKTGRGRPAAASRHAHRAAIAGGYRVDFDRIDAGDAACRSR